MKKVKIFIGVVSALCALSLAGCSTHGSNITHNTSEVPNTSGEKQPVIENNDGSTDTSAENNDANSLIKFSAIQGDVIQFSHESCTITPVENSADGNVAVIDAPGNENSDNNVTIHYQNDCVFQIAKISISSGTATFSEADISDIKKQTSLIIYGDWSDKHNLNATKVFIARYEQEG